VPGTLPGISRSRATRGAGSGRAAGRKLAGWRVAVRILGLGVMDDIVHHDLAIRHLVEKRIVFDDEPPITFA